MMRGADPSTWISLAAVAISLVFGVLVEESKKGNWLTPPYDGKGTARDGSGS